MRYKKVYFLVACLWLFIAILPISANSKRQNIALTILRNARVAHENGNHEEARALLIKARFIWKNLPTPAWAITSPTSTVVKTHSPELLTRESGQKLLFQYLAKPTGQTKSLLEAYLKQFPDADEIRRQFYDKAALVGHTIESQGHSKASPPAIFALSSFDIKIFLAILVLMILIWQIIVTIVEYRAKSRGFRL